ncbi:ABC transporter ATP-binding protein [Pelagibius sp.]|uniref:ABC transporter ATP-binding protein n=1 Tax=Pelagibius sp. TaxID=1931238 RepID=UPI0026122B0E|nr:ABC transporter ATP-binding protein [Pelagibius sp.]
MGAGATPAIEVRDLETQIDTKLGLIKAVDGVAFTVDPGETLGIVGESGSGKSITALSLLRLVPRPAARIVGGEVILDGEDLLRKSEAEMRKIRGRHISMILQDPQTSLNPVFSIGAQVVEAIAMHAKGSRDSLLKRAIEALRHVRVADPARRVDDFPHQMSGGMKQRVVGAIALGSSPRVLIADEPTTALDVTIQAQYLRLLKDIQAETGLAIIFITHDFGVVARMCDKVAVMYAGRVVEYGPVREIFVNPAHPYTRALLKSVPTIEEDVERLYSIRGQPPAFWDMPRGCRFEPRCDVALPHCKQDYPPEFTDPGSGKTRHCASCWALEETEWTRNRS